MASSPSGSENHAGARVILGFTLLNLELKVSTLLQQGFFVPDFLLFTLHTEMYHLKGMQNKLDTCAAVFNLCNDRIGKTAGQVDAGKLLPTEVLPTAQGFAAFLAVFVRALGCFVHIEGLQRKCTLTVLANNGSCRLSCQ